MNGAVWRLSSARSGAPATAAASTSRSFAGSASPGVPTTAAFVTAGNAAAPTDTVSVKLALSVAAMTPAYVAVTMDPADANDQPAPVPPTYASPGGSVSVTATVPAVGAT